MIEPEELAARLRTFLGTRPEDLAVAYLFGSYARGEARESSDVDLGVLFRESPPPTLDGMALDLQDDLRTALGLPVQVVVLDRAPVDLIHRVLRDGVLVLERDRSRRIAFEVRSRNEYFDLRPILDRYRHPATVAP
jgi:predicted nucleotidyltransferase